MSRAASRSGHGQRRDIQFVRAVAVLVVLAFHLWPGRFPGGFIGVDVFFVISGFLITAHLVRESAQSGRVNVLAFWGRRALRLLPLATTVLIVTSVAVAIWAPPSTWRPALEGIIASTVYAQNWALAADSVNYLARDQAPIPTQHFWSLSVEEQFYIAWPLLLIVALSIAALITRRPRAELVRPAWAVAIALIGLGSFGYSLWLTVADPGLAYFSTFTRAWQFAAGAALAFVPPLVHGGARPGRRVAVSAIASWVGLMLIVGATVLLPEATPFPGVAALVPVVGAALLLWAGTAPVRFSPSRFGDIRVLERIGDLSYGIYLWHWPLIVLVPAAIARPLGDVEKVIIIAVSIGLAAVSKRLIEDPFRYGSFWHASAWRRFVPGATGMAASVAAALIVASIFGISLFRSPANVSQPSETGGPSVAVPESIGDLRPSIADRGVDFALMYDCFDFDASGPYRCDYGDSDARVSIAIVGDSHAAHMIPGLVSASESEGWRLSTFVGMNCDGLLAPSCHGGVTMLDDIIEGEFDLVLVGAYRGSSTPFDEVVRTVEALTAAGVPLAVIGDVPAHPRTAFECLDANFRDLAGALECTTPRAIAIDATADRLTEIGNNAGVDVIDLTEEFCDARVCQSIIGDIVVYQDSPSSHLTSTMSRALAPVWARHITVVLDAGGS